MLSFLLGSARKLKHPAALEIFYPLALVASVSFTFVSGFASHAMKKYVALFAWSLGLRVQLRFECICTCGFKSHRMHRFTWHHGQVVKVVDLKSTGLCLCRFKSCRCHYICFFSLRKQEKALGRGFNLRLVQTVHQLCEHLQLSGQSEGLMVWLSVCFLLVSLCSSAG